MKAIVCVCWGDKYSTDFVKALKEQVEKYCTYDFNFYCFTDNVKEKYDRPLPHNWDSYANGNFWAYRKTYLFDNIIEEDEVLYLDLDILIKDNINFLFDLDMTRPYIVKGIWNDIDTCRKNYSKMQSPMINSSMIRWNKNQMQPVFNHIQHYLDVIFFTYPTLDNYLAHFWFDMLNEKEAFFNTFPSAGITSYYKGEYNAEKTITLFNNDKLSSKDDLEKIWSHYNILQN